MERLLKRIWAIARKDPKRIVFPESDDPRVLEACKRIAKQKLAHPILLGSETLSKKVKTKGVTVVNPKNHPKREVYAKRMYQLRKSKGWSLQKCKKMLNDPVYFGTMMVERNDADGLISGARHTTANTLRPALQLIKTEQKFHKVSGLFLMFLDKKLYLFADCAVNIQPSAKELAQIACDSVITAKQFGLTPKVAMLSFSTHGSAKHSLVDNVKQATKYVKKKMPRLKIDGELQVDSAISDVYKLKAPKSPLKGQANILIFPDLQSGNISYKFVQRLAGAKAIGPIIQGLKKPVNDLSRGCTVNDIVNLTAITVVEAQK